MNNNQPDNEKHYGKKKSLITLAAVLGIGVLAVTLLTGQMLGARAQTSEILQSQDSIASSQDGNYYPPYKYGQKDSTLSTTGTATTKVTPDKVTIQIGVETNATTAQEAASQNADLVAQVISAIKGLGVNETQIGTSSYNVYPVYETHYPDPDKVCIQIYPPPPDCQPKSVIVGYKASNIVSVTLDSTSDDQTGNSAGILLPGNVIDAAIDAGANNINGVSFFVSSEMQQQIRDALITDAINNAKHRANIGANALDAQIAGVQSVSLTEVYFPVYAKSYDVANEAAQSSTQLFPGEQELSTSVNVVFFLSGTNNTALDAGTNTGNNNMTQMQ